MILSLVLDFLLGYHMGMLHWLGQKAYGVALVTAKYGEGHV
jgi:hypothetical protein